MAINRLTTAALRALSYPDLDLKKNYRLDRAAKRLLRPRVSFLYQSWNKRVTVDGRQIPVRLFVPEQRRTQEFFLFFHGGGWVSGDMDTYTSVCGTLAAETGRRVLSVDYRLAPEHRFPCGLEDCYAVARTLFCETDGVCADDVILIGDSAGGNLAAALSLMAADRGEFMPRRQVLIYPAVQSDFGEMSPFRSVRENGQGYLLTAKKIADYLSLYMRSEADLRNPYFSPLLAGSLAGQPKTLVITAEFDPLRDEGEAYAARLAEAGVAVEVHRVPDALHGFFSLPPVFDVTRQAYGHLAAFLGDSQTDDEKEKNRHESQQK